MLGGAPGGGLLPLGGASLAAASGQPHAGENYALLAQGAGADEVEQAARFFAERGAEFVTPWLPQTPQAVARALEERGIERRRIYTSMYLPVEAERGHGSPEVAEVTAAEAARWGEAAWYAFGGEAGEEARAYAPFGEYLANHPKNRAFALEENGRYVSTALIHETPEAYGLYYFATVPERRRQGLAAKLMDGAASALPEKNAARPAGDRGRAAVLHQLRIQDNRQSASLLGLRRYLEILSRKTAAQKRGKHNENIKSHEQAAEAGQPSAACFFSASQGFRLRRTHIEFVRERRFAIVESNVFKILYAGAAIPAASKRRAGASRSEVTPFLRRNSHSLNTAANSSS